MALPTLADSDVVVIGATDSGASKTFAMQAGDLIVVAMRVYQGDSTTPMTGANVTDTVNGAYTLQSHATYFVGGSDRLDEYVFSLDSSASGSTAVTINPPGSVAYSDISVSVWRGGTFTFVDDASASGLTSSPMTATVTAAANDYLMVGSGSVDASAGTLTSNGTTLHLDGGAGGFGQLVAYRTFESDANPSITWTVSGLSGVSYMGYAAAAWRFVASGGGGNRRRRLLLAA